MDKTNNSPKTDSREGRFNWQDGDKVKFLDPQGNEMSSEQFKERVKRKAAAKRLQKNPFSS